MLTTYLGLGALCIAAAMCVLIHAALTAPLGWQDETGFHFGLHPMPAPGRDGGANSPGAAVTSVSPVAHEVI